jgi:hypothetical protein
MVFMIAFLEEVDPINTARIVAVAFDYITIVKRLAIAIVIISSHVSAAVASCMGCHPNRRQVACTSAPVVQT